MEYDFDTVYHRAGKHHETDILSRPPSAVMVDLVIDDDIPVMQPPRAHKP